MKQQVLIRLQQALAKGKPLGSGVELDTQTVQALNKLLGSSAPITARQARAVRRMNYRPQRQAGVLKTSATGKKRTPPTIVSKLAKPEAGMFRRKPLSKRSARSRTGLYAVMISASSSSSGTVSSRLFDDPGVVRVEFSGLIGARNINGVYWQNAAGTQHRLTADLDPGQFRSVVLAGAYDGDLAELQITSLQAVFVSDNVVDGAVSYSRGLNALGTVTMPGHFARIFPPTLTFFGPFQPNVRQTGSANLRTAPQFDLKLGPWTLRNCYLHIQNQLNDQNLWDTAVYVNGTFSLFGMDLPMSSHLSTQDGFLSFNLQKVALPPQPVSQLAVIDALFPFAALEAPWAQSLNLLRISSGFTLTGLHFMLDVTTGNVSSFWLRLRFPGFDLQGKFPGRLGDIEIGWLVGLTGSEPEISTSGIVAQVTVGGFEGATWECYVKPWPELTFSLWTPSTGLSLDSVHALLAQAGAIIDPESLSKATGFYLTYHLDRTQIHMGLKGKNAQSIL